MLCMQYLYSQLIVISSPGSIVRAAATVAARLRGMNLWKALVQKAVSLLSAREANVRNPLWPAGVVDSLMGCVSIPSLAGTEIQRLTETNG